MGGSKSRLVEAKACALSNLAAPRPWTPVGLFSLVQRDPAHVDVDGERIWLSDHVYAELARTQCERAVTLYVSGNFADNILVRDTA